MIFEYEQDAWSIFSIGKDHDLHRFFMPTVMGRPYSATTGGDVIVCNKDLTCVAGVKTISFSRPFSGGSLEHDGPFTVVDS